MKVAYVHLGQWPSPSPCTTFCTLTAYGLAENAQACFMVVHRNSKHRSQEVFEGYFGLKQPANLIVIQLRRFPIIGANRIFARRAFGILQRLAKQTEIDAVISRNHVFLPYLSALRSGCGIKTFFETHDFYTDLSIRDDLNISRTKHSKLERQFIPGLTGLICLQDAQRKLFSTYYPGIRTLVAPGGVFEPVRQIDKSRRYVAYVGSLDEHKGIETLLEAISLLKHPPEIVVFGAKNEKEARGFRERYARFKHLRIHLSAWLSRKQLHERLSKVRIGVIPLTDTFFNRYLTCPLKLFDYYGFGIPVVASRLPSLEGLIEDGRTGMLCEPENPKDFATKIDILFSDDSLYDSMVQEVLSRAQTMTWDNRAKKIISMIREDDAS